jgi:hypothetical protein
MFRELRDILDAAEAQNFVRGQRALRPLLALVALTRLFWG